MPAASAVDYDSSYRWVMAVVTAVIMTTSFISLTAFGVAAPEIAKTIGVPVAKLTTYGVDSFSIGLFVAFFLGHGGIFDTRIKSGICLAQVLLILPQVLIPVLIPATHSLWLFTALRFCQGLMIMMLALFSIQLSGWFRPSQRGIALGAMLGAITLGGAIGGLVTGSLASLDWQALYFITAGIMGAGAAVYFLFAHDSAALVGKLRAARLLPHTSAWRLPMTWIMGLVQIPLTWTLFSIGGFMPAYAFHLGYNVNQVGNIMFIWGVAGFFAAVLGSLLGDDLAHGKTSNRDIVNARLHVISLGNLAMALGAVMVLYLAPISYALFLVSAIVVAFMMAIPPNYWATPGSVFPLATMGAGAFGMGMISNSTSAIGPVVSSALVPTIGWSGVFWIMAIVSLLGIAIDYWAKKTPLPIDVVQATAPSDGYVELANRAGPG